MSKKSKLTKEEIDDQKAMDAMFKRGVKSGQDLTKELNEGLHRIKKYDELHPIARKLYDDGKIPKEEYKKIVKLFSNNEYDKIEKEIKKYSKQPNKEKETKPKKEKEEKEENVPESIFDKFTQEEVNVMNVDSNESEKTKIKKLFDILKLFFSKLKGKEKLIIRRLGYITYMLYEYYNEKLTFKQVEKIIKLLLEKELDKVEKKLKKFKEYNVPFPTENNQLWFRTPYDVHYYLDNTSKYGMSANPPYAKSDDEYNESLPEFDYLKKDEEEEEEVKPKKEKKTKKEEPEEEEVEEEPQREYAGNTKLNKIASIKGTTKSFSKLRKEVLPEVKEGRKNKVTKDLKESREEILKYLEKF